MSSDVENGISRQIERRRRHRSGLNAETIVAALLIASGHRILARRFKTPVGEIDLIAVKAGRIAFVEVKRRSTSEDCEAAITPMLRHRVRRAANLWLARNPRFQRHDIGFDLVFVVPWRFPLIMHDAL
ncbi:MAG TPA: YraN family protein [Hyphomicrobium sp.]|uniref:YraN family protein n=1 Tax=Hyphomicrobium sp. TaxID=82 RepID=UPI002C32E388|nr:YraN family protein [Hyphomicrobium sp.]HXE01881.1 YraN family protein [Hyphomicrobium sp.]